MRIKKSVFVVLMVAVAVLAACSQQNAPQNNTSVPELGDKSKGSTVMIFKSPGCGCCEGYIGELNRKGFTLEVNEVQNIVTIKDKYKVPMELRSCHTAFVNGYFIEGHVPIEAVNKMLEEKPDIDGIVLDGMPPGSPGMPGAKTQPFVIYAVKDGKAQEYMRI